jgi:heme o synthase
LAAAELQIQQQAKLTLSEKLQAYYEFTKPRIWSLLVFTALTATYVSSRLQSINTPIATYLIATVAITAGTAGCNALTSYHDRDIDAIMLRTQHRPLPSGRITPRSALAFGLSLAGISLILAALLNVLSFVWMALGIIDNVVVYSLVLKRRSWLNILLGGFSGGLPVLFGWSAATPGPVGTYSTLSVLMAGLVFLWIPIHIWFLAVSYQSDYARAGVPMLPVVVGKETALRLITLFSLIFIPFSLGVYFLGNFGLVYGLTAAGGSVLLLIGSIYVLAHPTETNAWRMFKITSPYLFLLFVGMIVDVALRG